VVNAFGKLSRPLRVSTKIALIQTDVNLEERISRMIHEMEDFQGTDSPG
jgi:hypothetical protein